MTDLVELLGSADGSCITIFGKPLADCSREELYAIIQWLGRSEREARERERKTSVEAMHDLARMARRAA